MRVTQNWRFELLERFELFEREADWFQPFNRSIRSRRKIKMYR
jgi:hypothetical protein